MRRADARQTRSRVPAHALERDVGPQRRALPGGMPKRASNERAQAATIRKSSAEGMRVATAERSGLSPRRGKGGSDVKHQPFDCAVPSRAQLSIGRAADGPLQPVRPGVTPVAVLA